VELLSIFEFLIKLQMQRHLQSLHLAIHLILLVLTNKILIEDEAVVEVDEEAAVEILEEDEVAEISDVVVVVDEVVVVEEEEVGE